MGSHSRTSAHRIVVDDAAEQQFFEEHGYTAAPRLVQWMATLRCPLSCGHCLAAVDHATADMPVETAMRLVDEAADLGSKEFLITGGEPLCRADLGPVLEQLARRHLPWSLNTAVMPTGEVREAIETHPPQFVAVSLDGPKAVHDSFRGRQGAFEQAMEAIAFFSGLGNCRVAAGTTVTTHNFDSLRETFHLATESGAHSWGIHLPVPEGRAAQRPDLFLSKRRLGELMRFVARRRTYFPVTMADEIGYTGDWEPQLRDVPFRCGAGIAQCVVLPDGSVVPCTTLDVSTAAGNIHDRPLAEIWRDGFSALRHRRMEGRCRNCQYAPACGGGCWLQRRGGTHCFRPVWHAPAALKTAAGAAICMGLLAVAAEGDNTPKPQTQPSRAVKKSGVSGAEQPAAIEQAILAWYAMPLAGRSYDSLPYADRSVPDALVTDPAGIFLAQYRQGQLKDAPALAAAMDKAMQTPQRSLAFAALMWRALAEYCMTQTEPQKRTPAQRKAVREAMASLEKTTLAWRKEIFDKKLDPYLARGRTDQVFHFMQAKIIRPGERELEAQKIIERDTAIERWGEPVDAQNAEKSAEPLEGYLERHPYAEEMRLEVGGTSRVSAARFSASGPARGAPSRVGIFDIIETGDAGAEMSVRHAVDKTAYTVRLPPSAEITYIDLLGMVYRQNEAAIDAAAKEHLKKFATRQLGQTAPLLLPAMLKSPPGQASTYDKQIWLADFWMF